VTYFWRSKNYVERAEWAILCGGPSLNELDPETFNPQGPVVAVNFAVTYPVRIDYLCALDGPPSFSDWVLEAIPKHVIVMCQGVNVEAWRKQGFRTWHFPSREVEFREQLIPERCPDMSLAVYTQTSMFPALGVAIHCGARILNIYGADLAGSKGGFAGYGKQDHDKTEEQWENRWVRQRSELAEMQSYWEIDPGVDFIYHNRPAEVEADVTAS